jgi:4a-hydroxytetrahydrobiopterin dehydratase
MTTALADKTCTPRRGGVPPLEREKAEALRANCKDWELLDDAHRIQRKYHFAIFREALNLVEGVGELAEAEAHRH